MPQKNNEDLVKVTIRLYDGDKEELDEFYPSLGHNRVIRDLVRKHIRLLRERISHRAEPAPIDLSLED